MYNLVLLILAIAFFVLRWYLNKGKTEPTFMAARQVSVVDTVEDVNSMCSRLAAKKKEWRAVSNEKKLQYLLEIQANVIALEDRMEALGNELRHIPDGDIYQNSANGHNLVLAGQAIGTLIELYRSLVKTGAPPKPPAQRKVKDVEVAKVWPISTFDFLFSGFGKQKAEVWVEPGVRCSQEKPGEGTDPKLVAILGPGNIEGMNEPLDALFVHNNVAVFKSNPVNRLLTDNIYPIVFHKLVEDGFIGFCSGGVDVGAALTTNPDVDELFMVGSCATYDRIVWGAPGEQEANKKKGSKVVDKKFTAELGAVSPWCVVPGSEWSDKEMTFQVNRLVGTKVMNQGHACASPQLVIVDKAWPQAQQFVDLTVKKLKALPNLAAYYPGVGKRLERYKENIPSTEVFHEERGAEGGRFYFVPDVDKKGGDFAIREEAFGPMMAVKYVNTGNDADKFMKTVVPYINKDVFGSLSCNFTISPASMKKIDLDSYLHALRWGSIGINVYAGTSNAVPNGRWGAYLGEHPEEDIQSGQGHQNNMLMVKRVSKTVVYAPFFDPLPLVGPPTKKSAKLWAKIGRAALHQSISAFIQVPLAMFI